MSAKTRSTVASLDANSDPHCHKITGLIAGEAIAALSACYIDAADGLVYEAVDGDGCHGFAPVAYRVGQAVTLYGPGATFDYSTSMIPGAVLYLSASVAGGLDTAGTGSNHPPVALCLNATDIQVLRLIAEVESSG